jgi:hypothetical protein
MSSEEGHHMFGADDTISGLGFSSVSVATALGDDVLGPGASSVADMLCEEQLQRNVIDYTTFVKLCDMVCSRVFGQDEDVSSENGGVMLLPFIDLCNGTCIAGHENVVLETLSMDDQESGDSNCEIGNNKFMYTLRCIKDIPAGQELLLLYRATSTANADYLLTYGYLPIYRTVPHAVPVQSAARAFVQTQNVQLTNEVVNNPHNYVDLHLHRFTARLLQIVNPPNRSEELRQLAAAKWRHVVEVDAVPEVLRVTRNMLVKAQPEVLPAVSQICR